jgi:uncharacterized GH25 family protein
MLNICFRYAIRIFVFVLYTLLIPNFSLAHEMWLDTKNFQPQIGDTVAIELRNGQNFKGINLSYFKNRIENFFWELNSAKTVVKSRSGDIPAMKTPALENGLMVVVYHSRPSTLTYKDWQKFDDFIQHKNLGLIEQVHESRNLSKTNFIESYKRFSKALIGIGPGQGNDRSYKLETEFVVLTNPYTEDTSNGITVLLLYQGIPRKHAQIEVFQRSSSGDVSVFYIKTNAQGKAIIDVLPGHDYLLDSVILRIPEGGTAQNSGAVWESLWAATTFSIPTE